MKAERFDVTAEIQLYQQGGAILSYFPDNLENSSFVHFLSSFYSPPFKIIYFSRYSPTTTAYLSLAFIVRPKMPISTNLCWGGVM